MGKFVKAITKKNTKGTKVYQKYTSPPKSSK